MHTSNNISNISFDADEAVYLQIADYFRRQVAISKISPGDRLPAIRALAKKLNLDPGTVARAYKELEKGGVIKCRRGNGSFVSDKATEKNIAEQRQRLTTLVEKTVIDALGLGFSTEELETMFTLQLAKWRKHEDQSSNELKKSSKEKPRELRFSGSHDLAIELLASHLNTFYQDMRFITSFVGSLSGLMALGYHEADIAGSHLMDDETGEYNIPFIKRLMPNETVILVNLMQRVQGLMIAPGNPKYVMNILDLKRPDIIFINRQRGSGTRILLDSQLRRFSIEPGSIKGYEHEENTHVSVATLIAQGQADVGLGAQSAATMAQLDFIPLLKERYDLVMLQEKLDNPYVQRVIDVVRQESFQKMLRSMSGYDLSDTGTMVTVNSK